MRSAFRVRWHFACAASFALFAWTFSSFYIPDKGFTFLATIGDKWSERIIPELRALDFYMIPDSWGYDGMTYAQIAMVPDLTDPELAVGVDNLPYRARRILFCWTAWLAGGGDPGSALFVFTIQNAVAWLLLAFLLFRWLPPLSFENFARWFAILFSFGFAFSIRYSLVDGPSLLLIACGIALAEKGRPWLAAVVLGVSGLGKETNLAAAAATDFPTRFTFREWLPWIARGLIVVLPIAIWISYLLVLFGGTDTVGKRNFDLPFEAFIGKWRATIGELAAGVTVIGLPNLLVVVSLTTQLLFFVLRPRWRDRWWRLGAAMSLLMIVIGEAVWEGHPSAAVRVLLPMLLAFNLTVPRGWRWAVVLILGNISILAAPSILPSAPRDDFRIEGPLSLRKDPRGGAVKVLFEKGWYGMERSKREYWRWSSGPAEIVFSNPHDFAVDAEIGFALRSRETRDARLVSGEEVLWSGTVSGDGSEVRLDVELPPGDLVWRLETTVPSQPAGGTDLRLIAFSLQNFKFRLVRRAGDPPGD